MSPHAVPEDYGDEGSLALDGDFWKPFGISSNGFLPAKAPLGRLSSAHYAPWELIMERLPELLRDGRLRDEVDRLAVLSTAHLGAEGEGEDEHQRAYVVLGFLAHAYIWGGETASERLPPAIAVPFLAVSRRLELPPVATYASLNLWNYVSNGGTDLDSLRALHTFTDTESESWFLIVAVAMEFRSARVLPTMLRAVRAAGARDFAVVTSALHGVAACIRDLGALLDRMHEGCDPLIFYRDIRPFLAGSKNMAAAGLPRGVFYDEGGGRGAWMQLRGGSNGQSALIQLFDVVLGVVHRQHDSAGDTTADSATAPATGDSEEKEHRGGLETAKAPAAAQSFHAEVRAYMPGPHRRLLEHVERMGSIRSLALAPAVTPEHERLARAFQHAVDALADLRKKHLAIATRYIVLPSRMPHRWNGKTNLASASSLQSTLGRAENPELTGTGGTALMTFLKQVRDETVMAGGTV